MVILVVDFMRKHSPQVNRKCHIDGLEVYHPLYLGNMEVTSEMDEIVRTHRLASSGGTDIHVDKTLGADETVSSDSVGGRVKNSKLKKFRFMRRKSKSLTEIKSKMLELRRDEER